MQSQLAGAKEKHPHIGIVTRMFPGRAEQILDGGSLYWVMKGQIKARQTIADIRRFKDTQGVSRCWIALESEVVLTTWAPYRPFQGWRYLEADRAPPDIATGDDAMPLELQEELASLGLV